MHDQVLHQLNEHGGTDIYISAAAISDFAPDHREGKIPSGKPVTIDLHPLPKLLDAVRSAYNPFTVAFKIGRKPETKARAMIRQGVAMVLMNTPETMGSSHGSYTILDAKGTKHIEGTKDEIAAAVWSGILRRIA
jgi:phosphopantothenoylcysteine decarboxylase/phosphopantothenate--cysteine ligase